MIDGGDAPVTAEPATAEAVPYTLTAGLLLAQHRVWTVIAASHEDDDGHEVVDPDKIGEREEEWVGYVASKDVGEKLVALVGESWREATVGSCTSLEFGNCFVVRLRRPADAWFAAREWRPRRLVDIAR